MLARILFTGLVVAGLLFGIRDGRVLRAAGLTGSCTVVQTGADGAQLEACRAGKLEGMPSLSGQGCTRLSVYGGRLYWKCPAPLVP